MPIQSPYKLIVAAKDGTVVRTVDLASRCTLTIGRSPRCDLTMDIESISRRHATMVYLDGSGPWLMRVQNPNLKWTTKKSTMRT